MEGFEFTIRASELKLAMTEPRSKAEMFSENHTDVVARKSILRFFWDKKRNRNQRHEKRNRV